MTHTSTARPGDTRPDQLGIAVLLTLALAPWIIPPAIAAYLLGRHRRRA